MPKQRKKARGSTATTRSTRRSRPKRSNSSPNQPLTVQNDVLPLTTQNEAHRVPSANEIASSIIPQLRGATGVGQLPASTSLQEVINLVPGPTANTPSSSTVAAANPESLGKESRMTGQDTEAENQQLDLSYLTVKQKFKDKSSSHQGSLKIVVLIKWGITVISFVIFLASLVVSKLTLFGLVNGLNAGKDATVLNYQTYCMCFVLLLAPNIISLLRSLWNITGWFDLPWPGLKAVGLITLSAAMESVGLCIVLFKTLTSGSTIAGVSGLQIGLIIPIIFYTIKGQNDLPYFRHLSFVSIITMLAGSGLVIFIYIKESEHEAWTLVGVFVAFLSMFPYLNNKIFEDTNNKDSDYDCTDFPDSVDMQSGSNNPDSTNPSDRIHAIHCGIMPEIEIVAPDGIDRPPVNARAWKVKKKNAVFKNCFSTEIKSGSNNPDSTYSSDSVHSSSCCCITRIENGEEDGKYTPPDNASAWKIQLISAVFKILFSIIATSAVFIEFAVGKMDMKDAVMLGWNWSTSDRSYHLFIAHIVTSLIAYVTAVFAFHTCIHRGAFLLPILLSSPVVYTLMVLSYFCEWFATFLDQPSMFCANRVNVEYSVLAMVCTTLSIFLVYGRLLWHLKGEVLLKETQLFWYPAYNSVMLEQWMLLNKKINIEHGAYRNDEESGKKDDTTPKSDDTTPKSDEITPKSDDTTPKCDEKTAKRDETTPKSDDTTPNSDEITPKSDETTPKSDELTPKSDDTTPKSDEITPKNDGTTLKSDEITPKSDDTTPKCDEKTPKSDETTPKSDDTTPKSDEITPKSDETTPKSDDTTPKSDEITPKSDGTTLKSDDTTPNSNEITPKSDETTPKSNEITPKSDETTQWVYICTTMYRESRKEMQQLLESIQKISQGTSDKICFESHIFVDGAVREKEMTEFALQLIGLLNDTLHIDAVSDSEKTWTPYGLRFKWDLTGPNKMKFYIHLKDSAKVKKKKRWSQIMYMSYILDFLSKQHTNRDVNPRDTNKFILTTDADVRFNPESVEALLDLMKRDTSVGAVCARTYPLGSGPVMWYQKFEYAVGHWFQKAAEHVLGSVLCAPGCFSMYRCLALKKVLPKYASNVERAFDFLMKDMGEDRWLCTLLIQNGWRIDYCAASENETFCPEKFEEFYKQRRRWIVSTLANLISLITHWHLVRNSNHQVSFLFCLYQIILFALTFIGPSTVVCIVAGGLSYSWNINFVVSVILQVIVCLFYAGICLFGNEKWQMKSGKIITFLYSIIMAAVFIGLLERIAKEIIGITSDIGENVSDSTEKSTIPSGVISDNLPVSFLTLYLGVMCAIFLITTLLHPYDFTCLLNGLSYLFCLPSAYVLLYIYSIINIIDSSWGTREEKKHNSVKLRGDWYESFVKFIKGISWYFGRKETPKDSGSVSPGNSDEDIESEIHQDNSDSIEEDTGYTEPQKSDEVSQNKVEKWLPEDMKNYAPVFKDNGFDNTRFLSMLTKTDLKRLGIQMLVHREILWRKIQDIPKFIIPVCVPKDPYSWLQTLGLEIYKPNFQRNHIKSAQDMEALKSFSKKDIEEELGIKKTGHLRMIVNAIKRLRIPTNEERIITKIQEQIRKQNDQDMRNLNGEENKFWNDLIQACLQPSSGAFSLETILKGELQNLRNRWLTISGIVNCLWIFTIMTLSGSIHLKIAETDPLSLLFLVVFGFIFVLQFLCMIIHRFTTLCHLIARAQYRWVDGTKKRDSKCDRSIQGKGKCCSQNSKTNAKSIKNKRI